MFCFQVGNTIVEKQAIGLQLMPSLYHNMKDIILNVEDIIKVTIHRDVLSRAEIQRLTRLKGSHDTGRLWGRP